MELNDTNRLTEEYSKQITKTLLPNIIMQCTALCIGVIGNIFVLVMYSTKMNGKLTESRYFLPVLSVFDLIACLSAAIFFATETFMWMTYNSDILCKAVVFTNGYAMATSTAFLLVLAIQRYKKICCLHSKRMSLFWRRITVVLVILTNLVYSAPLSVLSGIGELSLVYKEKKISGMSCFTGTNEYPTFEIVYFGSMVVITVAYMLLAIGFYIPVGRVIYRIYYRRRRFQQPKKYSTESAQTVSKSLEENGTSSVSEKVHIPRVHVPLSKYRKCKTNFTLMIFTIITIYCASYIPMYVILIFTKVKTDFWTVISFSDLAIYNGLIRIYIINHITNPFIYVYFDIRLRQSVTSIFRKTGTQ